MNGPTSNVTGVLSAKQVAEVLGVHYETVLERIHDGSLRAVKRGGRFYIRRQALEDFLADEPIAS